MTESNFITSAFFLVGIILVITVLLWIMWLKFYSKKPHRIDIKLLQIALVLSVLGIALAAVTLYGNFAYREGRSAFETHNYKKAATAFNVAAEHSQKLSALKLGAFAFFQLENAYDYLGQSYMNTKDYSKASAAYEKASKRDLGNAILLTKLGSAYLLQKNYTHALKIFRKVDYLEPKDATVHFFLGLSYAGLSKDIDAENQFKESIALDKNLADPYYALGRLYAKQGKVDKAINNLKQAIEMEPSLKQKAQRDKSLASLTSNPEFISLVK